MFDEVVDEITKAHKSIDYAIQVFRQEYKPGQYAGVLRQLRRSRRELEDIINLCDFHSQANGK